MYNIQKRHKIIVFIFGLSIGSLYAGTRMVSLPAEEFEDIKRKLDMCQNELLKRKLDLQHKGLQQMPENR